MNVRVRRVDHPPQAFGCLRICTYRRAFNVAIASGVERSCIQMFNLLSLCSCDLYSSLKGAQHSMAPSFGRDLSAQGHRSPKRIDATAPIELAARCYRSYSAARGTTAAVETCDSYREMLSRWRRPLELACGVIFMDHTTQPRNSAHVHHHLTQPYRT